MFVRVLDHNKVFTGVASPSKWTEVSSSAGGVEHGGADARLSCVLILGDSADFTPL